MATTGQQIIDEVRAVAGEESPTKLTDILLLRWINQEQLSVFHKFVDVLQEKFLTEQTGVSVTWSTNYAVNVTITAAFKVLKVINNTTPATPVFFKKLILDHVEEFIVNSNYATSYGWISITETSLKVVRGGSVSSPVATIDVTSIKKPTTLSTAASSLDLPDEFHDLTILGVKKKAFEILQRVDRQQLVQQDILARIQDIENSYRIVVKQTETGKPA